MHDQRAQRQLLLAAFGTGAHHAFEAFEQAIGALENRATIGFFRQPGETGQCVHCDRRSRPRSSSPNCADRSETFNRAWWPKRSIGKRSHEQRVVIAIHLTSFVAHSVSTPDYLPARPVLHRRYSRDDRSWLVDISQRLGRHLSVARHSASDPGVAWRASSWAADTIRMHSLAADRVAICIGAPGDRRPTCDWSWPACLGCRTPFIDRCRSGGWFVRLI